MTMNNNNSKTRKKAGVNPVPLFLKTDNIMMTTGKKLLKDVFLLFFVTYKGYITFICDSITISANRVRELLRFFPICLSVCVPVSSISQKL